MTININVFSGFTTKREKEKIALREKEKIKNFVFYRVLGDI